MRLLSLGGGSAGLLRFSLSRASLARTSGPTDAASDSGWMDPRPTVERLSLRSPPPPRYALSVRRSHLLSAAVVLAIVALVRGESPPADPRFESPVATVRTFWQALALGPADEALECFVDVGAGQAAADLMGMPALQFVHLRNVRVELRGDQCAIVRYEVWYQVQGSEEGNTFNAGDELLRVRGQWRIHRPLPASSKSGGAPRRSERRFGPLRHPTPDFAAGVVDRSAAPC